MFETLTDRLSKSFAFFRGQKELTAENVEEGLRQVRTALLEADVHFKVVKDFTDKVRVLGRQIDVPVFFEEGLTPPELCLHGIARARHAGADLVILDTAGRLHID